MQQREMPMNCFALKISFHKQCRYLLGSGAAVARQLVVNLLLQGFRAQIPDPKRAGVWLSLLRYTLLLKRWKVDLVSGRVSIRFESAS